MRTGSGSSRPIFGQIRRWMRMSLSCLGWLLITGVLVYADPDPPDSQTPSPHSGMDRFDLRAAVIPARNEQLDLVRKSFERQRWDEGIRTLQQLLDDEQDSVALGSDRVWRPVSELAWDLLNTAPPEALNLYLKNTEPVAGKALQSATANHDLTAIVRISRRFLATSAGQRASRILADVAIDSGNADALATQVRQLLRINSSELRDATWMGTVVEQLSQMGYPRLAMSLRNSATIDRGNESDDPWTLTVDPHNERASSSWDSVSGTASGGRFAGLQDSLQLPRWQHSLLPNRKFREAFNRERNLLAETASQGISVLGSVGRDDLIVVRTIWGLAAFRVSTGEILWYGGDWTSNTKQVESSDEIDFDSPLLFETDYRVNRYLENRILQLQHFCPSLGALSADSHRVYSLSHFPTEPGPLDLLLQPGFIDQQDETLSDVTFLTARDLKTGRILWRAGGPPSDSGIGLPAEGTFLFGPPTAEGGELFAVGERHGDILLFCLEPETGFVRWEQLLATAGQEIELDTVRKNWTAPVSVRGSLVICPTTTGWVTAVDRITHQIVWSSRLSARDPADEVTESGLEARNQLLQFDGRWDPAQPLIVGDRVLMTAIEFPDEHSAHPAQLACLDLATGEKLWERPKFNSLGIAGCSADTAILFESRSIEGISLQDGSRRWVRALDDQLAGRPVLTPSGLIVPLVSGQIVCIHPDDGEIRDNTLSRHSVTESSQDVDEAPSLGNLTAVGQRLISVSPKEIIAFEWLSETDRWKSRADTDLNSAIRYGVYLSAEGRYADAADVLRKAVPLAGQDTQQLEQLRMTRLNVLFADLRHLMKDAPGAIAELPDRLDESRSLVRSPSELVEFKRLEVEIASHVGDWALAWKRLQECLDDSPREEIRESGRVQSFDIWIADRILDLGRLSDHAARQRARTAMQQEFQRRLTSADESGRKRLARQFSETGLCDEAIESLAANDPKSTLSRWQTLENSRNPRIALTAQLRIIESLAVPDWIDEARRRWGNLPPREQWPEDLRTRFADLPAKLEKMERSSRPISSWLGHKIELSRVGEFSGAGRENQLRLPLRWEGKACPGVSRFDFFYRETQRSIQVQREDGTVYCDLPLATNDRNQIDEDAPIIHAAGLNVYVFHMGILHAFSLVDRCQIWRHRTSQDDLESIRTVPSVTQQTQLHPVENWNTQIQQTDSDGIQGLVLATDRYLVLQLDRTIEVIDQLDGSVIWQRKSIGQGRLRADQDTLFSLDRTRPWCCSLRTGREITVPDLNQADRPLSSLDPLGTYRIREQPGSGENWLIEKMQLQAIPIAEPHEGHAWDLTDVATLEVDWTFTIPRGSFVGHGPEGQLLAISPPGAVQMLDLQTGRARQLGQVPPAISKEPMAIRYFGFCDTDRIFLLREVGSDHGELDCPSIPAFGQIIALPLQPSVAAWQQDLQAFLLTRGTRNAPFLPMLKLESHTLADRTYQRVTLQLLDKATGQAVFELKNSPSWGQGASSCDFDPIRNMWALQLAGETIQLREKP